MFATDSHHLADSIVIILLDWLSLKVVFDSLGHILYVDSNLPSNTYAKKLFNNAKMNLEQIRLADPRIGREAKTKLMI